MKKKKQYVSPSVLRAAPFAPRASLLASSSSINFGASTEGQNVTSFDAGDSNSGFKHEWED